MGENRKKNTEKIAILSFTFPRAREWAKWTSKQSEQANGWASSPVLTSGFLVVLAHSDTNNVPVRIRRLWLWQCVPWKRWIRRWLWASKDGRFGHEKPSPPDDHSGKSRLTEQCLCDLCIWEDGKGCGKLNYFTHTAILNKHKYSNTHKHSLSNKHTHSLSNKHTHTHSLSNKHTHTVFPTYTHTQSFQHTHTVFSTHTHTHTSAPECPHLWFEIPDHQGGIHGTRS